MIRKYSGGTFAPCGTYVSTKSWEFHSVLREGGLEGALPTTGCPCWR
jgi:hypothetical protein